MTRGVKTLITILIILVGLLAVAAGFFFAKSISLQKELIGNNSNKTATATKTSDTNEKAEASEEEDKNTNTTPSSVTAASSSDERPSAPADTYTVKAGDTMFSIGQDLDVNWTVIAAANGLSEADANKIKVGDVLLIPKNNQINYTVNTTRAETIQDEVDGGKDTFRLSATDTAKADAPTAYGLTVSDTYTEKTVDPTAGTATVTATHEGKNYEIKLTQPVTKGDKGIWAISSIKLAS